MFQISKYTHFGLFIYFLFKAGGFKEDCTRKPRGVKENIRISMYFSHSFFCFYGLSSFLLSKISK